MNETWIEMRLRIPAAGVELVGNELTELGCAGLTVEERQLDTFVAPDPEATVPDVYTVKAYFPATGDVEVLRRQVYESLMWLSAFVPGLEAVLPEVVPVSQEDWAEGWKQHFSAVRIGRRLVVKPTWEDFLAVAGDVVVNLDPGMAFGTGTHGTTRLCLDALAALFDGPSPPQRVLDVGTGSGILAIAAAALGARRTLACDVDAEACRIASENAALNGVGDHLEVTLEPLSALAGDYDLVLANILAEENIRLANELVGRVAPGGALILSGILLEKEALVIEAFAAFALTGPGITRREEWSCLLYRKGR
jgi:ribosomal protein L11 methyltransferase